MARKRDKEKALRLRQQGKSYSQIRDALGVSKSTLSCWLADYPLSSERIKELRDENPRRIEKFRRTMRRKREEKLQECYVKVVKNLGKLSKRDEFIAGFFLYWAEGTKIFDTSTSLSNTDPSMLRFFIGWLEQLGIDKNRLRVRLHLYSDMDIKKETVFWSKSLKLPVSQFRKPYIKATKSSDIKYNRGGYGHGTCNIIFGNRELNDYVLMGIKYLQEQYS